MAKNRFQLDKKKADKNADGKLIKFEEDIGNAMRFGNFDYDLSGCAR